MEIGVALPQVLAAPQARTDLLAVARRAEQAGLASVWVGDHVTFPAEVATPYPYHPDGTFPFPFDAPFLEALTTLAFVAAGTERVLLGTSVLVAPLRQEVLLARQLATIATLAPDRLVAGVGAGWMEEEFAAVGRGFADRGAVLDEQVAALRALWSVAPAHHDGAHVRFPDVFAEPRPPSPIPLWVGGNAAPALRRAGRLGDAWHAAGGGDGEQLAARLQVVRAAAEQAGRDPAAVALTARTGLRADAERGWHSLDRRLSTLAEAGCRHVLVDPGPLEGEAAVEVCDRLGETAEGWR